MERDWEIFDGIWFKGFNLERVDCGGEDDEGGAMGDATGHEEASAGDCGEFWGGNGEVEVVLCMGQPGWRW